MSKLVDSKLAFRIALAVSVLAVVLPILTTRYLPFTDAPEHAAVMATLAHWTDPLYSAPYELAILRSQYLLYHLGGAALTLVVGDAELANRLLLALAGISLPLAFRALLRAAGRDERLALFACLPFWSRALVIGFLPFVASIPIALYGLALVFRDARNRRRRGLPWIAALSVVLFYAHVSTWMVFVVVAGAVVLFSNRARALPLLGALAPSGLAAAAWLAFGKLTVGAGTLADASETSRMRLARSLVAMPIWVFDVWKSHGDELAAGSWWIAFLVVALGCVRSVARYSWKIVTLLYLPAAFLLVIYLVTPWRVGAAAMLNVRLAPLLVLLGLLPLRLPRRSRAVAAALGMVVVANVVGGVTAFREMARAHRELGDLDAVLDAMPAGARLLSLNFDPRSSTTHYFPWGHVGAYHRVRGGGVAGFSFSELKHWPIHYRASAAPPVKAGALWDLPACSFRNSVDGAYYDFVLVRGKVDPFVSAPEGSVFRPVVVTPPMTLYRKESGVWPHGETTDDGPCVGRLVDDAGVNAGDASTAPPVPSEPDEADGGRAKRESPRSGDAPAP